MEINIDPNKLENIIRMVYLIEKGEGSRNTSDKKIVEIHKKMIKEKVDAYKED